MNAKEVLRAGEAPQSLILSPDNASRGPDERKFPAAMSSSYQLSAKGPVRPLHAPEACCTRNIQVRSNLLIPATPCATALHTQILPGETWSPRNTDTPVNTGKTNSFAQIPGPRRTHPEPTGHRNHGTVEDRILLVSVCTHKLKLCHSFLYPNSSWRELVSQEY